MTTSTTTKSGPGILLLIMALFVSILNIISTSMYIDIYNKHNRCIKDKKWKDMKKYMVFLLVASIIVTIASGSSIVFYKKIWPPGSRNTYN
tara:strand:+ start:1729 stop:2001 length:273 start_codon:yes stop_codon:yes gene_type:complete